MPPKHAQMARVAQVVAPVAALRAGWAVDALAELAAVQVAAEVVALVGDY